MKAPENVDEGDHSNPYAAPTAVLADAAPAGDSTGPVLASRWARLAATVLDFVIVSGPAAAAVWYDFYETGHLPDGSIDFELVSLILGIFVMTTLVINVFMLHASGQTIGKKMLGIRLVRGDGRSHASVWRIIGLRFLPVYLLGRWIPVVGPAIWGVEALTIFGRERKCLHDYLADTLVITEDGAAAPPKASAKPAMSEQEEAEGLDPRRLVLLATVEGPMEAAFVEGVLEEQQIRCRVELEALTVHDPFLGDSNGESRVFVDADDLEAATAALSQAVEEEGDLQLEIERDD